MFRDIFRIVLLAVCVASGGVFAADMTLTPPLVPAQPAHFTLDADGNQYIVGNFTDILDLNPGQGDVSRTGTNDIFVYRLNADGGYKWGHSFGGSGLDTATAVTVIAHRNDKNINELKNNFNAVLDWVTSVFTEVYSETKGLEWGRLYDEYHGKPYDPAKVAAAVEKLMSDEYVTNRKGIFEYVLGGSTEKKLLAVRVFDEKTKKVAYTKQTQAVKGKNKSNCPLCATGDNANKNRIYDLDEMDTERCTCSLRLHISMSCEIFGIPLF